MLTMVLGLTGSPAQQGPAIVCCSTETVVHHTALQEHGVAVKPDARTKAQRTPAASSSATSRPPGSAGLPSPTPPSAGTRAVGTQQQSRALPQQDAHAQGLKPATEFDGFTAVVGSGAALGANRTATPSPAAGNPSPPLPPSPVTLQSAPTATAHVQGSNSPRPAQQRQVAAVSSEQVEELQHCLALIASQPGVAGSCMEVLSKLLSNLATAPQEAKYRQLRLGNPKIQLSIVNVPGALEFLAAVGFQIHTADIGAAAAASNDEHDGFAVFIDDQHLGQVHEGIRQLQRALPVAQAAQEQHLQQSAAVVAAAAPNPSQHTSAVTNSSPPAAEQASTASAPHTTSAAPANSPAAPRIPRETQVLLPAAPDTTVPDWFFERTGAELKADYMAMLKARQTGQVFARKSWKEAQLGRQSGPKPVVAVIRTRFPEGVCLQGNFHVSEPVTAVFEWVTESLRDPTITYELIKPDRKPLAATGLVNAADLAPAVLLNFRPLTGQQALYSGRTQCSSFLRDSLLAQAQAD
eukprot:GHUV01019411.1.p1 GENE.GHUV01019411.1~~GHUV01019411.1.p1  ORF type:complete len:522 (+),score=195.27 GHUV01019411.1:131-1696(+)